MANIEEKYASYDGAVGDQLRTMRGLVFDVAANTQGVGQIEESLKWGQPSFVTVKPKSGSTVRIDAIRGEPGRVAMYFICSTNLVEQFRELYPDTFDFRGNRALVFDAGEKLPEQELRHCIAMALTYHI